MVQDPAPYYDSAAPRRYLANELRDLYQYRHLISQLTLRNITVRYKRSFLGVLWTMLDPLLTMLVMTFVFSALLRRQIPNFPIYLLTALVVWSFHSQASNGAIRDFVRSGRLIAKVYLPQSVFVIVSITTGLVNLFISLGILFVIALVLKAPITLNWLFLPVPIIILTFFTLGTSLILAPLGVYFSDIESMYNILLRLLMYLSAIFYPIEILPDWLRSVVDINPLYHFISLFRAATYTGVLPSIYSLIYVSAWSAGLFAAGILIFTRLSDDISLQL